MNPDFWSRPFAHRGLHDLQAGRVENALSAITAAVEAGYGVEFDVQISADGEAMVFHDDTLERLTDRDERVDCLDSAALRETRFSETEETIPTLTEVLERVDGGAPLLIEIKDQSAGFTETNGKLEARVCDVLKGVRSDRCAVMSFNPSTVRRVHELMPGIPVGLVSYDYQHPHDAHVDQSHRERLAKLDYFKEVGAQFVSYGATSLPTPETEALRNRGVPIFCWTIRSQQQADAVRRHCDQITFEGFAPS